MPTSAPNDIQEQASGALIFRGDGALSFLFESLGCDAYAIDNPVTNYNRTHGFRSLKTALNSSVECETCDLDAGPYLRGRTIGMTLCLGVLYHLKNPFAFLETLASVGETPL